MHTRSYLVMLYQAHATLGSSSVSLSAGFLRLWNEYVRQAISYGVVISTIEGCPLSFISACVMCKFHVFTDHLAIKLNKAA